MDEDPPSPTDDHGDDDSPETKIRVSFILAAGVRKDRDTLELPTDPIAVPASIRKKGLSAVVNHLLDRAVEQKDGESDSNDDDDDDDEGKLPAIPFDFLLNDKLLRMGLESAARKEGLSLEHALELHYFPARLPPKMESESEALPDWISTMDYTFNASSGDILFTGGCDGMIRAFSPGSVKNKFQQMNAIAAHTGPIKCLSSTLDGDQRVLVATGSMDQTLVTHTYDCDGNSLSLHAVYSGGHSNSISSVTLSKPGSSDQKVMASADWDGGLAIWKVPNLENASIDEEATESSKKRQKNNADTSSSPKEISIIEVKPIRSIKAHASNISGMSWSSSDSSPSKLITGSWDHSLKVWDIERADCILALNGSRVVTAISRSFNSDVVATAHPDCAVRLWDMRTNGVGDKQSSQISDRTLRQSHKSWVSDVKWSPTDPFVMATTGHDGTLKVWDIRSSLPLHTVRAVSKKGEKALCLAFGDGIIYSGGSDCVVKQFACKI